MVRTGFSALDSLTGGLEEAKSYLLYGDIGTGKTTFSLQFLYQGLISGETALLVTRRSAQAVFDQGRAFGMDLESFAKSEQLILFEYTPRVVENSMKLKENEDIFRELDFMLGNHGAIERVVFDPVTPVLASPSPSASVFRARTLIQACAELNATTLYIFDTPEGEEYLGNCKDFVFGVLRFEQGAAQNTGKLALERLPGVKGKPSVFEFEVTAGAGMVDYVPQAAGSERAPRKIVLLDSDAKEREIMKSVLGKSNTVLEAEDMADALAMIGAENPDLLMIEHHNGTDGLQVCRKLRKNKMNLPIVVIANQIRRSRDRVEMMSSGADECLERPLDARIVRLKVEALLRRYEAERDRFSSTHVQSTVTVAPERDKTTQTTNLAYFYDRLRMELGYSADNALSFAVLVLNHGGSEPVRQAAAGAIREYDLVLSGAERVAVLLAESDQKGVEAYLNRVRGKLNGQAPGVKCLIFDSQPDFVQQARQLIETEWGRTAHA